MPTRVQRESPPQIPPKTNRPRPPARPCRVPGGAGNERDDPSQSRKAAPSTSTMPMTNEPMKLLCMITSPVLRPSTHSG